MVYKFLDSKNPDIPNGVLFGNKEIPDYNFNAPIEFEQFGLYELMEGVFEYPGKSKDQVRQFLNGMDFKAREEY